MHLKRDSLSKQSNLNVLDLLCSTGVHSFGHGVVSRMLY